MTIYQQYLDYIYIYMNYTMHLNVYLLSISMHMHGLQAIRLIKANLTINVEYM